MKKILIFLWLFPVMIFASESRNQSFDFQEIPISQVIGLYFQEVVKKPYLLCSEILEDMRPISLRASGDKLDAVLLKSVMNAYAYDAREENGVLVVCKKDDEKVSLSKELFVYKPLYRESAYLVDLAMPIIKGTFANKRVSSQSAFVGGADNKSESSQSIKTNRGDDYIIFEGDQGAINKLKFLLTQLDIPKSQIVVNAFLYEVGKNNTEGSALGMVLSLLGGKFEVNIGADVTGNTARIKTPSLDFVASALNSDSRFRIVTNPHVRVRSGETVKLQVGQDVPVLGGIVTNGNGQSQQSIEYRQSGVILEVTPMVRDGSTDLDLTQTVSDFVRTETGLASSPTLNKREIKTSLSLDDGEVVVIGGLSNTKTENQKNGIWFLPFDLSNTSSDRTTELLLLLEVKRI